MILALVLGAILLGQQCAPQSAKLVAPDRQAYDRFGSAIASSGDFTVVGSPDHGHMGTFSGAAYVFRWNGSQWVHEKEIFGSDIKPFSRFGSAVGVGGDTIVVGAPGDTQNGSSAGAAYVFRRNTAGVWNQEVKLVPADGLPFNEIGTAVSISGDAVLLGAHLDDTLGLSAGAAYIFRRNGTAWNQEAKLLASDGIIGDKLGVAVAISDKNAVVGAWGDDDNGSSAGAIYIFRHVNGPQWVQEAKLYAGDPSASDFFGCVVAASGDKLVSGSVGEDDGGSNSGAAYVFRRSPAGLWSQEAKLKASDLAASDAFGGAVAIDGPSILIGSAGDDDNGPSSGSAYVFHLDGAAWVQKAKIKPNDPSASDVFGGYVSMSGVRLAVSAWSDDDGGNNAGSAYAFTDNCGGTVDPCLGVNCDDGNPCTVDSCQAGVCLHVVKDCDDNNPCTVDACCGGSCKHEAKSCGDNNPCTVDSCVNGTCVHQ